MNGEVTGGRGPGVPRAQGEDGLRARNAQLQRAVRDRLSKIEADVRDGRHKFFNASERDRLEAALVVTQLFVKAQKAGHRRKDIDDALKANRFGLGTAGVRLDRWILRRGDTVVDEGTVERYRDSKNPQRRIEVYLRLIEFFAHLLGEEAEPHKLEMFRKTSLWRDGEHEEPEPARRLADLLHACALSVANRIDVAALFSKATLLHVGWNPESGREAVPLSNPADGGFGRDTPVRAVADNHYHLACETPPFPAVRFARIPFGFLDETFLIEATPHATPRAEGLFLDPDSHQPATPCERVAARAVGYWDLWMCIAPVNSRGKIGAVFMESTCMDMLLHDGDWYETAPVLREPDFDHLYASAAPDGQLFIGDQQQYAPWLRTEGGWRRFTTATALDGALNFAHELSRKAFYRRLPDDDPLGRHAFREFAAAYPQERLVRFLAVDAHNVRQLLDEPRWLPVRRDHDGKEELMPIVSLFPPAEPSDRAWHRDPGSPANHLELALRDGRIEDALQDWARDFRGSMDRLEGQWLADVNAAEEQLRQRWRAAEVQVHGA